MNLPERVSPGRYLWGRCAAYVRYRVEGENRMKARKPRKLQPVQQPRKEKTSPRNRALHIPLDFEQAVEGLLNTKPKKKRLRKDP